MLLAKVLSRVLGEGQLTIIDSAGTAHRVTGGKPGPSATMRVHDRTDDASPTGGAGRGVPESSCESPSGTNPRRRYRETPAGVAMTLTASMPLPLLTLKLVSGLVAAAGGGASTRLGRLMLKLNTDFSLGL